MECPRCGLDNMPGSTVCFQCQADLLAPPDAAAPAPLYPGRAQRAGLGQGLHRERAMTPLRPALLDPSVLAPFRSELAAAGLSLLPGLGQYHNGQHGKAVVFGVVAGGLLLLNVATFFTPYWTLCLWLLLVEVAISMLEAALTAFCRRKGPLSRYRRAMSGLALLIVAAVLASYTLIVSVAGRFMVQVQAPFDLPSVGLVRGQTLVGRRIDGARETLSRGDLVIASFREGEALTWIVGLPGEHLSIEKGQVRSDGAPDFALPVDVSGGMADREVPPESYAVIRFTFLGRLVGHAGNVAIVQQSQVIARVVNPPSWQRDDQ